MNERHFHTMQQVIEGKDPNPDAIQRLLGKKLARPQGGDRSWRTPPAKTTYRLTQKGLKLYTRWRSHQYELEIADARAKFEQDMANARRLGR